MRVAQKVKNGTTVLSSNCTSGYISKENKNTKLKRYLHPNVRYSIIYNSQDKEAIWVSTEGWVDKEIVVCIYRMEYYSAIKKNEIFPFVTTLEGPQGHYAKWNKSINQT